MFSDGQLLALIDSVYEAATDPVGLGKLAHVLARAFETDNALVVFNRMPRPGAALPATVALPSATENFDAQALWSYAEYYHDINIMMTTFLKDNRLPFSVICDEMIDDTTLMRHEFYDYCRQTGGHHCLATAFGVGDDLMGQIGIHRARHGTPFEAADKRKLDQLVPHLQRALQLQHRLGTLERERAFTLEILEGLAIGIVVVNARCELLFANKIARRALERGAMLSISGGYVRLGLSHDQSRFQRLVADAAQTSAGRGVGAGGMIHLGQPAGAPVALLVSPLRSLQIGFGPAVPGVAVVFSDPDDAGVTSEATLAALYGLTPAETQLLAALASGKTLAEYADHRRIAIGTARAHLKSVLQKSGHHRQVDIVRAVAQNPLLRFGHDTAGDGLR